MHVMHAYRCVAGWGQCRCIVESGDGAATGGCKNGGSKNALCLASQLYKTFLPSFRAWEACDGCPVTECEALAAAAMARPPAARPALPTMQPDGLELDAD